MAFRTGTAFGLFFALAVPAAAGAQEIGFAKNPIVSELRLGLFAHDMSSPEGGSADINGEVLLQKPALGIGEWGMWFVPRPHLGATINFSGRTSHVYTGLTWSSDLGSRFFIEGSLGLSVNDGHTGQQMSPSRNALGCHTLFREAAGFGIRIAQHLSIMTTLEHMSNAGACAHNRGLTNYGVRLGYTF